jgi:predicted dehydrogenase
VLAARKFGFESATTDVDSVFGDHDTSAVVVATRHDSHAQYVLRALGARKHVFVEKPLCLNLSELDEIESEYNKLLVAGTAPMLVVGFNRRFSPFIVRARELLGSLPTVPKAIVIVVNGGAVPAEHWTQDLSVGGGRIAGEACHFIDLVRFLVGAPITSHRRSAMRSESGDTVTLSFEFTDGSIGTVHYFANGHRAVPKERVEIFCAGRVLRIDNFRSLTAWGWKGFKSFSSWRQDKGQSGLVSAIVDAVAGRATPPIPVEEIFEVARLTILLKN